MEVFSFGTQDALVEVQFEKYLQYVSALGYN